MDLERYEELRTILQQWNTRLACSVRGQIEDNAYWLESRRPSCSVEQVAWLDGLRSYLAQRARLEA